MGAGASAAAYLLIPSSKDASIENIEQVIPKKTSAVWKEFLVSEGYEPVLMSDEFETFPGLDEAFKKAKGINEEGISGAKIRDLWNSFEKKEALNEEDKADAKRWCSKPKYVADLLVKEGRKNIYTVLEDGQIRDWDQGKLRSLTEKYMKNDVDNLKMTKSRESVELLVINEGTLEGNIEAFKSACTSVLTHRSFEENLNQKLEQGKAWCTESNEVAGVA